MSVDLTDPNIAGAYDDIIKHRGKDWLLLSYGQTRDRLTLFASGEGNIDALRENIPREPEDVYFGFCRERDGEKNYYAMIAYVPQGVSGVRRARALVHSRAVGSLFKAANNSVSVSDREAINSEKLRERLQLGPSLIPRLTSNVGGVQRSASEPMNSRSSPEPGTNGALSQSPKLRNFASESQGRRSPASVTSRSQILQAPLIPSDDDMPPPTPPKDWKSKSLPSGPASGFAKSSSGGHNHGSVSEMGWNQAPSKPSASSRSDPMSDDGIEDGDEVVMGPAISGSLNVRRGRSEQFQPRPAPRVLSPAEKARIRLETQKQREAEEQLALQEEANRQARLKRAKEETMRQAQLEEDHRLARIEDEKRHALLERAKREMEAQMEEERRLREMEQRRQQERERRFEQARRIEEERQEAERRAEETRRKREEERRLSDLNRKQKIKDIQRKLGKRPGTDPLLLSGNVTVQTSMSISWKRRYFELTGNALLFYRDSKDRASPLDIMPLSGGRVGCIREPSEGYDELEAIAHSFAVELTDGDGPWCMFSDSAEDKDILISLLSQAAGLL